MLFNLKTRCTRSKSSKKHEIFKKFKNLRNFQCIKLIYFVGFWTLSEMLQNWGTTFKKTFTTFSRFSRFSTVWDNFWAKPWKSMTKIWDFRDLSEMLPRLKSHNFYDIEPFLKSRHSRNISWLQFVHFCRKIIFLTRLKYPTVHLPEAFFRKIPFTALAMTCPRHQ